MSVGKRIKQEREALGMSQDALEQATGGVVLQQMISKLETGEAFDTGGIVPLAIALNVTAEWLYSGKGPKHRDEFIRYEIETFPESVQADIAAEIHRRLAERQPE